MISCQLDQQARRCIAHACCLARVSKVCHQRATKDIYLRSPRKIIARGDVFMIDVGLYSTFVQGCIDTERLPDIMEISRRWRENLNLNLNV